MSESPTTTVSVLLPSGVTATVLTSDGDKTTIASPQASPPGSTVLGSVADVASEFRLKVSRCRKVDDHFEIEGRLRNATREMKARLTGATFEGLRRATSGIEARRAGVRPTQPPNESGAP